MSRKRSKYRPRFVAANPIEVAMQGAAYIKREDRDGLRKLLLRATEEFRRGEGSDGAWMALADAANMAEGFAAINIGGGIEAVSAIDKAQRALADVRLRHRQTGSWTMHWHEMEAIHWMFRIHLIQLNNCSMEEFERVYKKTQERMAQARAGNAPSGATVVE